jgi:hypothetical protein
MKTLILSKKGTSMVLGSLLMIIVVFAGGFIFFNFVMYNVNFAKTTLNTQLGSLLLQSVSANTTHIIAYIQNTAKQTVEFTLAYVNDFIATLQSGKATISPLSTQTATIVGSFTKGSTYTVKLTNVLNVGLTFTVTI